MKARDIEKIIARHILNEGSLDAFLASPDRSEAMQGFQDFLVQEKSRRMMDDLSPLATVPPEEILEAFQTFGPYETSCYLQTLGGQHRFYDIKSIYMAARKVGHPEESWDQIKQKAASAASFEIKNPQSVIRHDFEKRMEAAIHAISQGSGRAADMPFVDDRIYLNSILIDPQQIHYQTDSMDIAAALIEGVLDHCDSGVALTTEEECRLAGYMALACKAQPGADEWSSDFFDKTIIQHLQDARTACEKRAEYFKEHDDLVATEHQRIAKTDELIARVLPYAEAEHQLFIKPVDMAIGIYNYNLAQKIYQILGNEAPQLANDAMPGRAIKAVAPPPRSKIGLGTSTIEQGRL